MPRNPEHDQYGEPDGGSRWFVGQPVISEAPAIPVRQRWMCPIQGCTGDLVFNGSAWGAPPKIGYHHTCSVCGFTAALLNERYPKVTYR